MVFDFAISDSRGNQLVLVEVKNRRGADAKWAALMRRNWLSHGLDPQVALLLVVPEHVFVWPPGSPSEAPPTHDLDARPLFEPYLSRLRVSAADIGPRAFEQVIHWWLDDLTQQQPLAWTEELRLSGLATSLAGKEVVSEVDV